VAKKKAKKRSRIKTFVIYLFVPIGTWIAAFLIWFYWYGLTGSGSQSKEHAPSPSKVIQREPTPGRRPQENLNEEDRKRLDDILKRRG
jgi:flagellar basal body-associated protein FliL